MSGAWVADAKFLAADDPGFGMGEGKTILAKIGYDRRPVPPNREGRT